VPDPEAPLPVLSKPRGVGELLFEGMGKARGLLGGAAGIVAGIVIARWLSPETPIAVWVGALAAFLTVWVVVGCASAVLAGIKDARVISSQAELERRRFENERTARLEEREEHARALVKERELHEKPVVETAVLAYSPYQASRCVFIVRWSPMTALPAGARVIISTDEGTHERPLGAGFVRPPQQNGKAVVTLDTLHPDAERFVTDLLDERNAVAAVARIRIGPGYNLQDIQPPTTSEPTAAGPATMAQPSPAASSKGQQ